MKDIDEQQAEQTGADAITAPEVLDWEKALAAVVARAWCDRAVPTRATGRELVARLMEAATWINRARRHRQLGPISVADMIAAFACPVPDWLPGVGSFSLIDTGRGLRPGPQGNRTLLIPAST